MSITIVDMSHDASVRLQSATWAVEEWKRDFPYDTVDWYLSLYARADESPTLPIVLAAFVDDNFVGSASLIEDDELPDATEPGPWVAAVYVAETDRGRGIGAALVRELVNRAQELGIAQLFLYTQNGAPWYVDMGWRTCRVARLADHEVTVMSYDITNANTALNFVDR